MNDPTGTIAALWRFPVKSMGGERVESVEITDRGVVGDRAYGLVDLETGKVVSAKSVRHFPHVLSCKAAFVEPPTRAAPAPPVRITLPDGRGVRSDAPDVDAALSAFFGRRVRLAHVSPDDYAIDQYYVDVEGAIAEERRGALLPSKLGATLFAEMGVPSPVPPGVFVDAFPVSVLTTSTLRALQAARPATDFDERRFRMNLIVDTTRDGFVENDWIGRAVQVGDDVRLGIEMADPRCVMTTLAQDGLPQDIDVMRTLVQQNRIPFGDHGKLPCAGVYAVVTGQGAVRVGDAVVLT